MPLRTTWVRHWSSVDVAANVLEFLRLFVRIAFFFSNGMYVCVCYAASLYRDSFSSFLCPFAIELVGDL